MRLTVLGCSGTFPGPDSPCSSYLVEHDGFRLVVDAGNGSFGALQRHLDPLDVDAVLLSHLHADHCLDLVAWSYARRYHPDGTPPPLPVYGPDGTAERLFSAFDHRPDDGLSAVYDFRTVTPGRLQLGPLQVDLARTEHPVECHAVRLTAGGASLTYSADTGESEALVRLARDTDLLLCEASWQDGPDHPAGLHLTARQAGEHATRAGAGRLVLTHLVPWLRTEVSWAQAAEAYPGELEAAASGAIYDL